MAIFGFFKTKNEKLVEQLAEQNAIDARRERLKQQFFSSIASIPAFSLANFSKVNKQLNDLAGVIQKSDLLSQDDKNWLLMRINDLQRDFSTQLGALEDQNRDEFIKARDSARTQLKILEKNARSGLPKTFRSFLGLSEFSAATDYFWTIGHMINYEVAETPLSVKSSINFAQASDESIGRYSEYIKSVENAGLGQINQQIQEAQKILENLRKLFSELDEMLESVGKLETCRGQTLNPYDLKKKEYRNSEIAELGIIAERISEIPLLFEIAVLEIRSFILAAPWVLKHENSLTEMFRKDVSLIPGVVSTIKSWMQKAKGLASKIRNKDNRTWADSSISTIERCVNDINGVVEDWHSRHAQLSKCMVTHILTQEPFIREVLHDGFIASPAWLKTRGEVWKAGSPVGEAIGTAMNDVSFSFGLETQYGGYACVIPFANAVSGKVFYLQKTSQAGSSKFIGNAPPFQPKLNFTSLFTRDKINFDEVHVFDPHSPERGTRISIALGYLLVPGDYGSQRIFKRVFEKWQNEPDSWFSKLKIDPQKWLERRVIFYNPDKFWEAFVELSEREQRRGLPGMLKSSGISVHTRYGWMSTFVWETGKNPVTLLREWLAEIQK